MPTWTDDDGIVHEATRLITTCGHMVSSTRAPCVHDEVDQVLTCMSCAIGGGGIGELLRNLEKLDQLNKLCDVIKEPSTLGQRLQWVVDVTCAANALKAA